MVVGRHHTAGAVQGEGRALRGGDHASRLLDQEHPRSKVPGFQATLHIAVDPPRRHIAQADGGRADAPHVVASVIDGPHPGKGAVGQVPLAGIGAHVHQAVTEVLSPADVDGLSVAEGSVSLAGGEQFPGVGVVDEGHGHFAPLGQGQRYRTVAVAVDQVGGAVHRVQNPHRTRQVHLGVVLLLPHKLHLRGDLRQPLLQHGLHLQVHLGDKVGGSLLTDMSRHIPPGKKLSRLPHRLGRLLQQFLCIQRHDCLLLVYAGFPYSFRGHYSTSPF